MKNSMVKKEYPLVSVITTTFNNFRHIFCTINSVLQQNYPNIEYIISDDCSAEFPKEELQQYIVSHKCDTLKHWTIIQHSKNLGTVRNLNYAYQCSKGEYILNLSCGDCFFEKDTVSKIVERFIEKKSDVLVASRLLYTGEFNPQYFLPHMNERKTIERIIRKGKAYPTLLSGAFYDMASGSAMYFKRETFEKFGPYDEKYVLWEDGPFLTKYMYRKDIECAYDIVSIWYEGGGISGDSFSTMNPLMKKDIELYNSSDRICHLNSLNLFIRRRIKYRINKETKEKSGLLYHILYLPEMLYFVYYTQTRKMRKTKDIRYVNILIAELDAKSIIVNK